MCVAQQLEAASALWTCAVLHRPPWHHCARCRSAARCHPTGLDENYYQQTACSAAFEAFEACRAAQAEANAAGRTALMEQDPLLGWAVRLLKSWQESSREREAAAAEAAVPEWRRARDAREAAQRGEAADAGDDAGGATGSVGASGSGAGSRAL